MNAEIGIDEEGRAYIALSVTSEHEASLLAHLRAFLPIEKHEAHRLGSYRITGDRLPGSGGLKAQDASR